MATTTNPSETFHSYDNAFYDGQASKKDGNNIQSSQSATSLERQQESNHISLSPQKSSLVTASKTTISSPNNTTTYAPMVGLSGTNTTINATTNNHPIQSTTMMASQACGSLNVKNVVDSPFPDLIHHRKLIAHAFFCPYNSILEVNQITN